MISPELASLFISALQFALIVAFIITIGLAKLGLDEANGVAFVIGSIGIIICCAALWGGMQVIKPVEIVPGETFDTSTHQPIVSLNAKDRTIGSGEFMLGSGSLKINGEPRYFFYKKANGTLLTLDSIPAMGTYISEEENPDPNIEVISHHKKGDKKYFALWPGVIENWSESQPEGITGRDTIIHVPKGTVTIPNPFNGQVA